VPPRCPSGSGGEILLWDIVVWSGELVEVGWECEVGSEWGVGDRCSTCVSTMCRKRETARMAEGEKVVGRDANAREGGLQ